jgi:murein hydrolase activator
LIARSIAFVCFLALWAAPGAAFAAATPSPAQVQAELRALKARIDAVQAKLAAAEASRSEAADALREAERAISEANRRLAILALELRQAERRLTALREQAHQAEAGLQAQQAALGALLYRQYVAGRPETFSVLLGADDPNALARELYYLTYIGRARAELAGELRESVERLRALTTEAAQETVRLKAIAAEESTQRQRLEAQKLARSRLLAQLSRDISAQRREIGSLQRDEARLTRLIDELARVIARETPRRRSRAPEPRWRNERLPQPSGAVPFAQLRGRLALPVRGELTSRFGSPRQGGGVVWRGLFIAAPAGSEVRAIAAGRVVFADWLRGFGNLLIIDHGSSYMSLYAHNETLFKQVGELIHGGETIATVGMSGGQPESGLYFEMRHEGQPFDPMTWVNMR